jgi:hypothetical protein
VVWVGFHPAAGRKGKLTYRSPEISRNPFLFLEAPLFPKPSFSLGSVVETTDAGLMLF